MPFVAPARTKCTKCQKTVYTTEQIRAAGGTYHKGCLKCTVCGLTLNLKTCMAHENKPYCRTHKPTVGHTQVASVTDQVAMRAPKGATRVQGVSKDARMTFAPGRAGPRGRGVARGGAAGGGVARGGAAAGGGRAAPINRGQPTNKAAPAAKPVVAAAAKPASKPTGGAASGYRPSYGNSGVKVGGGGNKCPKCSKTVYANEMIKACGKQWHKGCLRCTQCNITLNLKTLNSMNNTPYCKVHVPKSSHTSVASVEMQTAMKAPKAARMAKGVDQTMRSTFAPGALEPVNVPAPVNRAGNSSDVQSSNAPSHLRYDAPEPTPHLSYEERDSGLTGQFEKMAVESTADAGHNYGNNADNYEQQTYAAPADQGYAEESYDNQQGYAEESYDNQQGYAEESYDNQQQGYAEESYDNQQQGYAEESYDNQQQGYAEEGYAEEGYAEEGYAEEGYAEEGYAEEGYAEEGYAEEGYAEEGYAEEYYEEGYAEEGYAGEGYAEEGYAEEYYEEGYAEEGYAEEGYAEEGYAEEYYEEGYYEEGYAEEEYYE